MNFPLLDGVRSRGKFKGAMGHPKLLLFMTGLATRDVLRRGVMNRFADPADPAELRYEVQNLGPPTAVSS